MSRFSGRGDPSGRPKRGSKNKGVMRAFREKKRIEAELRQEEYRAKSESAATLLKEIFEEPTE